MGKGNVNLKVKSEIRHRINSSFVLLPSHPYLQTYGSSFLKGFNFES